MDGLQVIGHAKIRWIFYFPSFNAKQFTKAA